MSQVVIANRLRDGIVVFFGTDNAWVESVSACPPAETDDDAERLLTDAQEAVQKQEVVDPILANVTLQEGAWVPVKRREAIRATGPTIRTDLGKQAGN
jgi:hypothetical protein